MIRVFPRRTKWTPTDELSFVGDPPLFLPSAQQVMISVSFTWDIKEGERLYRAWSSFYDHVEIGGPAFNDQGGEFISGRFIKPGVTITSRGCPRNCGFCLVPKREGRIRELPIKDGWIVQDNNLLACSRHHIETVFEMLRRQPHPADFTAGLDARLLKPWHIEQFKSLKSPRLWFACDDNNGLPLLERAAEMLNGFTKYCYALIGFNPNETMTQVESRLIKIWELGFYPFAMLYQGPNREGHKSKEWRQFQRKWCRPAAYKSWLKTIQVGECPMQKEISDGL